MGIAAAIQHASNFAFVLTTTLKLLEDQENFCRSSLGRTQQQAQGTKPKGMKKRKDGRKHNRPAERPQGLGD